MGHSERCKDLTTYWDNIAGTCAFCPKPSVGFEINPNCGYDDDGGFHEPNHRRCKNGTFNDGTRTHCRACTICQPGHEVVHPCSTTSDTKCKETRTRTTEPPVTESTTSPRVSASPSITSSVIHIIIIIIIMMMMMMMMMMIIIIIHITVSQSVSPQSVLSGDPQRKSIKCKLLNVTGALDQQCDLSDIFLT
ncbi:tumor necrosis factor receptor superfamily member 16-like [Mastacembelus armatus]|uniref:tumor necrosis factor receptor superfamily member 16-like n=1 Tax=Mastacembelus armatus TaxID=205130 RepID=UPI000E4574D1|nr:tumor necrosis factor receptor superfamily member 16-like [Mastacembelus armatus]